MAEFQIPAEYKLDQIISLQAAAKVSGLSDFLEEKFSAEAHQAWPAPGRRSPARRAHARACAVKGIPVNNRKG
jgi:hypothetical protein